MRSRVLHAWSVVRTSFWFVPALMALGAILLAAVMLWFDASVSDEWLESLSWIHSRSNAGARDLLAAVASSMITVAGLAFSIVVVALQLASSQLGPRLLRNFMADLGNQLVLGTFIATFMYCLIVMRTIGGETDSGPLPRLSVTMGVLLAMASLGVLIYFIHHAAASMQAPNVIAAVSAQLHDAIERTYPEPGGKVPHSTAGSTSSLDGARALPANESGYVQRIDVRALVSMAARYQAVIRLDVAPGMFVIRGAPLAHVAPGERLDDPRVRRQVAAACIVGGQRTPERDIGFTVGQLVEIALRALSPGVNDPFTAIACIDHLSSACALLLQRRTPAAEQRDSDGHVRVVTAPAPIEELVAAALDPVREAGRNSALVIMALLDALTRMAPFAQDDRLRRALLGHVRLVGEAAQELTTAPAREQAAARVARTVDLIVPSAAHRST